MSTSEGGYHEYIGGCSVHRRDIMIHKLNSTSKGGRGAYSRGGLI